MYHSRLLNCPAKSNPGLSILITKIYGSFATLPVRAWFFRYLSLDHSLPGIFRTFSTIVVSLPRCFLQLSFIQPLIIHSQLAFISVGVLNVDFNWFLTCLDFNGFKHFRAYTSYPWSRNSRFGIPYPLLA